MFGLKNFIDLPNCTSPNVLALNTNHSWPIYVSPGILLLLYYTATSLLKLRKSRPSDPVSPCHHLCWHLLRWPGGGPEADILGPSQLRDWYSGFWSRQRKEAPREDEEHELELDQLELESQARDASQVSRWSWVSQSHGERPAATSSPTCLLQFVIPTSTGPDIDNCTVHVLTSQSPVRQRPGELVLQRPSELEAQWPGGCPPMNTH